MKSAREALQAAGQERILLTDGAFGTEIQNWKLAEADYAGSLGLSHDQKGNNDILAITKPEVPETIHARLSRRRADIARPTPSRPNHQPG
jgi:5-methyltetrahydrofolate--homocysteine methyltransferase